WCSPDASRSARARSRGTSRWRTARGLRTRGAAARPCRSPLPARAPVLVDPVVHHLVQVSTHELLIAQRERGDDTRLEPHLRRLEGAAVLQGVLLDRGDAELLREAFAHAARRGEVGVRLEDESIVRGRPVVVRQVPTRLPEDDREVREDLERIQPPTLLV